MRADFRTNGGGLSGGVAAADARSIAAPWVHFTGAGVAWATERGIFSAKWGSGYGGSYLIVLGGGHGSLEASDGVFLQGVALNQP
jgi:hypothetical protein